MRGRVLSVAGGTAWGVISGEDGRRYQYGLTDLRSAAPQAGQEVDFQAATDKAREIYAIGGFVPAVAAAGAKRDWVAFYMSPDGRVARGDYWLYGFLVILGVNTIVGWVPIIGQIVVLITTWASIALAFKRSHDVDRSGWWTMVPAVPMVLSVLCAILGIAGNSTSIYVLAALFGLVSFGAGLWVLIAILARRGDPGPNRFGHPPLPMSG